MKEFACVLHTLYSLFSASEMRKRNEREPKSLPAVLTILNGDSLRRSVSIIDKGPVG